MYRILQMLLKLNNQIEIVIILNVNLYSFEYIYNMTVLKRKKYIFK